MAGDHQGAGGAPGGQPGGRPGFDPAAVADQRTQLDGAAIPHQAAPTAPPAGAPGGAPGGDLHYQPTALAFPAQGAMPPAGPGGQPPAFGAPTGPVGPYDPQAAGGYGYPQGPPTPPPAQGYAAPQGGGYAQHPAPPQPPAGYGAQPYGGQPGVPGAPAGPGYGYPGPIQPTAAPAKQRNPILVFGAVAGSVLVVAIVIALVVLFKGSPSPGTSGGGTGGGGGGGSDAGKYAVTWTVPKSTASGSDARTIGQWTTDKLVVRGDATGLVAYNLSDGKAAWTLKVPSGVKAFCSMSSTINKNSVGGVSFNLGDDDCAGLGAVDATTGKLLFQVGSPLKSKSFDTKVTVTDTTLAAASGALLAGYNLTDGKSLWSYKDRADYCSENADAAGGLVVVSDYCSDSSPKQQLTVLDANTGKSTQTFSLKDDNERLTSIVSVKPLVLEISAGYDGDFVQGIDASNNPMAKIPLKVTGEDRLQLSAASDPFAKSLVIGNTLYVEVQQNSKTAIRAIDLVSGKTLWTVDGGAADGLRLVDHKSGTAVTAIAMAGYNKTSQVVTLSAADGSATPVGGFSTKNQSFMPFEGAEVLLSDDGRVLSIPQLPIDSTMTMYGKG
ncbi:hypothetical protein GCM10009665_03930 [Kitasatospora nipponensis]|uniref:Pyrrolo-quinoline quinone repeat domain-containing protein n=1 Tax=Kitasatospora nipponensis TaxID=258049 RepID=A0ABN1VMU0_9ACTN